MQKIQIDNFGPLEKAEVEIKQMVVLIGEQASGKSTISKLVYFFKSLKEDLFTLIFNNLRSGEDIRILFIKEIQRKFYRFFGSTKHLPFFKIKYFYTLEKTIELSLNSSKYLNVDFGYNFYGEIGDEVAHLFDAIKQPSIGKNTYELIAIEQSKNKYLKQLKKIVDKLFEDSMPSLFVPAGRNITVTYTEQFKLDFFGNLSLENEKERTRNDRSQSVDIHLMLEFLRKIEAIKETFKNNDFDSLINLELGFDSIDKSYSKVLKEAKEIIFKILKGKYVHDRFGEKIVFDTKKRKYVHLNNASSGQQESIRILQDLFLILLNKEDVFRVIEEPEAHLYPLAQKNLIELIAMVVSYTNSQIVITTHSPYILSVINNLIFAKGIKSLKEKYPEKGIEVPKVDNTAIIDPLKFQAYGIKNSQEWEFISIFDSENQLIGENYLDEISQIVGDEFDNMFEVYKKLKPRKRKRKID
ncbi:AAA family ATPase [Saprospira grandis]|uniref:AAA family ATPase n=1 Tax=Saprospira grandis TaxID=1008 RepID=UPI0022DD4D0E|nr:AAA family ATPase [Saprospira grandis]WBM73458.1 ATP-binding protein [Saprospira grandis]